MQDDELEQRLNASTRVVTPMSATLEVLLRDVAHEGRARIHRRWRVGGVTAAVVVLLGGASAAFAVPLGWLNFTPDRVASFTSTEGRSCAGAWEVHANHAHDPEAVAVAEAELARIELTDAFVRDAVDVFLAMLPPGDPALARSRAEQEEQAVDGAVFDRMRSAIEDAGYSDIGISMSGNVTCEGTAGD